MSPRIHHTIALPPFLFRVVGGAAVLLYLPVNRPPYRTRNWGFPVTSSAPRDIAIVGVAESDEMGNVPGKSSLQHHAEAAYNALEDAGLQMSDIDGVLTAGFSTLATAEYFGIEPVFTDSTYVGGSSFVIHVAHAIAAIRAGYCETALITHGQAGRSTRVRVPADGNLPAAQYEAPYGIIGAPINYSMACTRYMHEYGEDRTRQGMAEIAVATRKVGKPEPGGPDARHADELRRLSQLALGVVALPPAGLLPGNGQRGGCDRHDGGAGGELPQAAGLCAGRR